jgi:hypothetical protein
MTDESISPLRHQFVQNPDSLCRVHGTHPGDVGADVRPN